MGRLVFAPEGNEAPPKVSVFCFSWYGKTHFSLYFKE